MKNIRIIISALLILFLAGCDVLDVEPYHSIPADQAITRKADVESAINGVYSSLQAVGYYGRNYVVVGDLTADNLEWTGTTAGYNQIDNNSILADNVIVEGMWSAMYSTINRANHVLAALPQLETTNEISSAERKAFEAEMLFIRALTHFDLARLFGPVPIRNAVATADDDDLNVPRQPLGKVFESVDNDLAYAAEHIRENIVRGKASKAAAHALMARVKLYEYAKTNDSKLLEDADSLATLVLENYGLNLEPDYARLFDGNPNNESIFEVNFGEQDRNRFAEYFFPTALSGRREFSPTDDLYNAFHDDDVRRDVSIASDGDNIYGFKYHDIETGTDNVYVLRLAEMYLIRAEALTMQAKRLDEARDDINAIRERAGLEPITTTTQAQLEKEIMDMRRLEFAFEGHRWFDLVRTGKAIDVLDGITQECEYLFPIPLGELLTNFHEGMNQNDCY